MKRPLLSILFAATVFAGLSGCSLLAEHHRHRKAHEQVLSLAEVPAAVQATILREAGDNTITEIQKVTKGDTVTYEADWTVGGEEVEVTVAADGQLSGKSTEPADDDEDTGGRHDKD
jgi:hypothetical protein